MENGPSLLRNSFENAPFGALFALAWTPAFAGVTESFSQMSRTESVLKLAMTAGIASLHGERPVVAEKLVRERPIWGTFRSGVDPGFRRGDGEFLPNVTERAAWPWATASVLKLEMTAIFQVAVCDLKSR